MNAASAMVALGPIRERRVTMQWWIGDTSGVLRELHVKFRVNYPSIRARGQGIEPQLEIVSIEYEDSDGKLKPMTLNHAQHAAVITDLAIDEEYAEPACCED